ncbi:MAG: hypothetical protein HYY25_13400 [Candidatus Wallbacteria bacterium]|nr:hypothetical protein [Candidatus Wallbacteria bacterium]
MRRDLAPRGALESLLVGRIVSAARRLRLLELVEAGLFARHRHEADVRKAYDTVRTYGPTDEELLTQEETPRKLEMQRQENHQSIFGKMGDEFDVAAPEFLERCKERWYEAMERRDGPIPTLAMAFLAEQKALANLARYEAAIERSLYRALHELQRIQAARSGQSVPLPAAVEVDVSVSDTRQDAA